MRLLWTSVVVSVVALGAVACSGTAPRLDVSPANLANLQAAVSRNPGDIAANLRLTQAYYIAGRFAEGRGSARTVLRLDPHNKEAPVYLGLCYEGLAQLDSARTTYEVLLATKPEPRVRRLLIGRLAIVARAELVESARRAIASESLLSVTAPDPRTVAVLPFRFVGGDSALRPLERGLAALLVTDLSRVHDLKVLERARLQALLDELQLNESQLVDPATGARSGRLVRAGQIVQGQFGSDASSHLRIDATVVRASDARIAAEGSGVDQLQALFDIEKTVVFALLDKLGITLTPGERRAISERPTRDIHAFLLYSRGLEESDRGDFMSAAVSFQTAAQRDPAFAAANLELQSASATSGSDLTRTSSVESAPSRETGDALSSAIDVVVPTGATVLNTVPSRNRLESPATDPNRICESATCDGPARAALIGNIIIIFRLP